MSFLLTDAGHAISNQTIKLTGTHKFCVTVEALRKTHCSDPKVSMYVYFDKKGDRYFFVDSEGGIKVNKAQSKGSTDYPQDKTVHHVKLRQRGECLSFAYKVVFKDRTKSHSYNKNVTYSWNFCVEGNQCKAKRYKVTNSIGVKTTRSRVVSCERFEGRRAAIY